MAQQLRQGDIVTVRVVPPRGDPKIRPALIYTPTDLIDPTRPIDVVGISTSYRPEDPDCIPLPWRPDGNVPTRLTRDSALCLDLLASVDAAAITATGGYLPQSNPAFPELLRRLRVLGHLT